MLDRQLSHGSLPGPTDPVDLRGGSALELLRRDAGAIHRRVRRIADASRAGTAPELEDLARIASAVSDLHRRILRETAGAGSGPSVDDVVAVRTSVHRSLELVRVVASESHEQ